MRFLKSRKNQIKLAVLFFLLTVITVTCLILFSNFGGTLESQTAAQRFKGESELRFGQVSAYFPVGKGIKEEDIYRFRQGLESAFLEASLEAEDEEVLYSDAYSTQGEITIYGEKGSSSAIAIGIGGEFFQFHPLYLRSGGYISGSDLMQDRVVLDEELAWQLFGGVELEGMTVSIGGKKYQVAGVVSREDDFASKKTYTAGAGLFMSYDALSNALSADGGAEISCYELVCADPVEGFALNVVKEKFEDAVAVQNSGRFSMGRIFGIIGDFGERSVITNGAVLPYWENAARVLEDYRAVFLLLTVIFAILPVLLLVVIFWLTCRYLWRRFKKWVPEYLDRRGEKRYKRMRAGRGE